MPNILGIHGGPHSPYGNSYMHECEKDEQESADARQNERAR
jgi:hypothetical protein